MSLFLKKKQHVRLSLRSLDKILKQTLHLNGKEGGGATAAPAISKDYGLLFGYSIREEQSHGSCHS